MTFVPLDLLFFKGTVCGILGEKMLTTECLDFGMLEPDSLRLCCDWKETC